MADNQIMKKIESYHATNMEKTDQSFYLIRVS